MRWPRRARPSSRRRAASTRDAVVDAIAAGGGRAETISLDVTDAAAIEAAIGEHRRAARPHRHRGQQRRHHPRRAAAADEARRLGRGAADQPDGAFALYQAALKPMLRQRSGRIIAISSVVGQMGNAGQANYAASKAGLIGFCKSLAREVASRSITVNVVAPGLIETDMTRGLTEDTKQRLGDADSARPAGHTGRMWRQAVCFLASDEASYITGHVLAVNGGMYT